VTPPAAAASRAAAAAPARRAPARAPVRRAPAHRAPARWAPLGPRRVSGPARTRPTQRGVAAGGLLLQLLSLLERLAGHRLLERLIRGRLWIGIVAFALIGIVTVQLTLLKLNGGVGRALEHEALLQRENAALAIENSEVASAARVQARASQLGMVLAPTSRLRFLQARSRSDLGKAAGALASHTAAQASSTEEGAATSAGSSSAEEATSSGASEASSNSEGSQGSESSESSPSSEGSSSSEGPEGAAPASTSSGSGEASSAGGSEAGTGE
jgi:cell division protein FtsL